MNILKFPDDTLKIIDSKESLKFVKTDGKDYPKGTKLFLVDSDMIKLCTNCRSPNFTKTKVCVKCKETLND